jgi:hypothetical protein
MRQKGAISETFMGHHLVSGTSRVARAAKLKQTVDQMEKIQSAATRCKQR